MERRCRAAGDHPGIWPWIPVLRHTQRLRPRLTGESLARLASGRGSGCSEGGRRGVSVLMLRHGCGRPAGQPTGSFAKEGLKPAVKQPTMNELLPYFIASTLAASAWTIVALTVYPRHRRSWGLVGAWAATMALAALWQPGVVPWLADFWMGVVFVWLGATALLIIAAALILSTKEPGRGPLLCCAALSVLVNVAAGLHFLWLATVSPGGV